MALILAYGILLVITGWVIYYIIANTKPTNTACTQECVQGRKCTCGINSLKGDKDGSSNN